MGQRITCIDTADQKNKKSCSFYPSKGKKCKASLSALNRGLIDWAEKLPGARAVIPKKLIRFLKGSISTHWLPVSGLRSGKNHTHTHTHTNTSDLQRDELERTRGSPKLIKSLVSCRKINFVPTLPSLRPVEDISERWPAEEDRPQLRRRNNLLLFPHLVFCYCSTQ